MLLVKNFEQIPPCDETNLPRLRVYSLEDQEMREIGTLGQPLTAAENDAPDVKQAIIYYGRGKKLWSRLQWKHNVCDYMSAEAVQVAGGYF